MTPPVFRLGLVAAVCALFLTANSASAQTTYTWTGNGGAAPNNVWTNNSNWDLGLSPYFEAPSIVVRFAGNSQLANVIDSDLSAVRLVYASGAGNYNTTGTALLRLSGTGTGVGVDVQATSGTFTYAAPIQLDAAQTWTMASGGTFAMNGVLSSSGAFALTKTGAGTLTLGGANTYTGVTNVNGGIVNVTSAAGLGATGAGNQTVVGTGAALQVNNAITIGELITINGDGISSGGALLKAGANTTTLSGAITLNTDSRFTSSTANGSLTITGGITGTDRSLVFGGPGNFAVNSIIATGAGSITKEGTGTLTLSGVNTYTGATTISAGALTLSGTGTLGTLDNGTTVTSGAALQFTGGATTSELISVGGTGISSGGALRNLSGTNTLNGLVTLTADTRINSDAGALVIGTGGITGPFNLTFGGAGNTTVSGIIATGGNIAKDGAGTLALSGANTFTGTASVSGGVLRFDTAAAIPGVAPTRPVTAAIGGTVAIGSTSGTAFPNGVQADFIDRINQGSGGVIGLAVDVSTPLDFTGFTAARLGAAVGTTPTFSGSLTPNGNTYLLGGGGGTLTVSSDLHDVNGTTGLSVDLNGTPVTSVVVLSGANDFTGLTTVNGGVLRYNSLGAMGAAGDGAITVGPAGTIAAGFALDATSAPTFLARINTSSTGTFALTSSSSLDFDFDTPNLTVRLGALGGTDAAPIVYSGTITPEGPYRLGGGTGVLSVTQPLTASSGLDVGVAGVPGTVILSAANTFTGGVVLNGGNLRVGNAGALNGNTVAFSTGSTGVLQLNGNSITLGGLSTAATVGSPAIENASTTAATLTLNVPSGNQIYAGTIRDGAVTTGTAAALSVIKIGAGTQTLTAGNTFTGTTTINEGVLAVSNATALGTTAGNTTVNANGQLQVTGTITIAEPLVLNGVGVSNTGAVLKTGGNITTLSGAITINSATRINSEATGTGNRLTISGAVGAGANPLTIGGAGDTTISGAITISGTLAHDSASVLTISNTTATTGNPATLTGPISVSGGGILAFPSQVALGTTGTNAITLDGGTLRNTATGTGGTFSPTNRGIVLAAGGGTLDWAGTTGSPGDVIVVQTGTVISGPGGLTKTGAGIISLNETATYNGPTTVAAGTLRIQGAANRLPTGTALTVVGGATFDQNLVSQEVGSLSGAGTVNLSGASSPGQVFQVGNLNTNTTFSGVFTSGAVAGTLTKVGTGTLTLTGVSTFTGTANVNGGTLEVGVGGSLPSTASVTVGNTGTLRVTDSGVVNGNVAVNGGGTLAGTGTVNGTTTIASGARVRGNVLGSASGTLTLSNNLTVNAGAVLTPEVSGPAATATSTLVSLTGTAVLNLTSGFIINIQSNSAVPMVLGENYSIHVVQASTINLNGSPAPATLDPSSYVVNINGFGYADNVSVTTTGGFLTVNFSPVPEPATVLGLAAGTLALGGLVRRRLRRTTTDTATAA